MASKYKRKEIRFDKGDTLGGTAPLLLMNNIRPVPRSSPRSRRFGRSRGGGITSVLGFALTLIFTAVSVLALAALGWDRLEIWLRPLFQ